MKIVMSALTALVAIEHVWFMVLEMFLWQKPLGLKTFGQTAEQAKESAVLAANQGLYNGFLAAGLAWSVISSGREARAFAIFFLGCVIVAGIFGGITVKKSILFVQAIPAAIALAFTLLA